MADWRMRRIADHVRIAFVVIGLAGCGEQREGDGAGNMPSLTPEPWSERIELAASLGVNPDSMTEVSDGVRIQDVRAGSGGAVVAGSTVRAEYKAWLPDGTLFEQRPSADGFGASEFVIGAESAPVPGVSTGMLGMKSGGVRRILVPATQGYGLIGRPANVPATSPLLFEVTLLNLR